MTITLETAALKAVCDALVDQLDIGATNPGGTLDLYAGSPQSPGALLASFDLPAPAFGDADAAGQATANPVSDVVAAGTGTVGYVVASDRDGTARWTNTDVGTSGTQIILNTLSITAGDDVTLVAWTVQAN